MPTKILVIDANTDGSNGSDGPAAWLRQQSYEVTVLDQAEQVATVAEQVQPDLVLLSASLQNANIGEVCQRLHQNNSSAHIRIILLTERSGSEARAESIRAGSKDFLSMRLKPANLKY